MSALLWDSSSQAFKESEIPKVYSGGVWHDTDGKVWNGSAGAFEDEAWSGIAKLVVGTKYTLGGTARTGGSATPQATCLAISDTSSNALMLMDGLYGAQQTDPVENELSSVTATYFGNLASAIAYVYLPRGLTANDITVFWDNIWNSLFKTQVYNTLKNAASNYASYGAEWPVSWLGSLKEGVHMFVDGQGNVSNSFGGGTKKAVCVPTFHLNLRKVRLNGNTIVPK